MSVLKLAALIVGIILLALAAAGVPSGRAQLGWLGIAFTWASTLPFP